MTDNVYERFETNADFQTAVDRLLMQLTRMPSIRWGYER